MELFGELFLTASLALFLSFLVAKLVTVAMAAGDSDTKPAAVSGEDFVEAMEAERRFDFAEGVVVEKVDHLPEEVSEDRSEVSDDLRVDDSVEESSSGIAEEPAANGVGSAEPDEARVSAGQTESQDEAKGEDEPPISIGDEDDDDDDDWEGIDRDELESDFLAAVKFVGGGDIPDILVGGDVQMELYGLRKVATEGTCHEPLPQALDLSDRANWLAWQRLGNMTRDKAMEKFINILSENVPGWFLHKFPDENEHERSEGRKVQSPNERKPEVKPGVEKVNFAALDLENKASESG